MNEDEQRYTVKSAYEKLQNCRRGEEVDFFEEFWETKASPQPNILYGFF